MLYCHQNHSDKELEEVYNKLGALKKQLKLEKIFKMKKIAVIDNYDSFTYNLVHYLEDVNCKVLEKGTI